MDQFDVVVIGAGPGGYVAAIRCAQLGLKVACIDARVDEGGKPRLGGTCLNVGCIPSKALLESSELYHKANHELASHGIGVGKVQLDIATMQKRKQDVVKKLTGGIETLFLKNKVKWIPGRGRMVSNQQVHVVGLKGEEQTLHATHIIIATGSTPRALSVAPFDGDRIVDSTGALDFSDVPKRLGIVGAGVIALELGSVWNRLGSQVTLLKPSSVFLPEVDQDVAKIAYDEYTRQGLDIRIEAKLRNVKKSARQVDVVYEDMEGREQHLKVDRLLVAIGRRPNTQDLNAEAVGLEIDMKGFITVDQNCRTSLSNVYAIGDVVRGPMLAHKASEEGMMVAELIANQLGEMNYNVIPGVIYTDPEVAWVGKTEQTLKSEGRDYKVGKFPMLANGRALAVGASTGLIKVLADSKTDEILGVHMICRNASELIAEAVVAMEYKASSEDIARIIHAHPSLSEAFHEAALAVDKRAIHI